MKRKLLKTICAYPVLISWLAGAVLLDAIIIVAIARNSSLSSILSPTVAGSLALALFPATLLGYFLGMFTCWPAVRRICKRYNGAPFAVGDTVLILAGRQKGTVAKIYGITTGQGGQPLLRLDIGQQNREKYLDLYEEYSVTRADRGEQTPPPYSSPVAGSESGEA